jgi:hypothetical protein
VCLIFCLNVIMVIWAVFITFWTFLGGYTALATKQTEAKTWKEFVRENPGLVTAGAVTTAATGGFLFIPSVLAATGFAVAGPVAGSLAAGWMSSVGVVQAGSAYSFVQSIAMGGSLATAVQGGAAVAAGGLAYLGMGGSTCPQPSSRPPPSTEASQ